MTHHEKLLTDALNEVLITSGIFLPGAYATGPELLLAVQEWMKHYDTWAKNLPHNAPDLWAPDDFNASDVGADLGENWVNGNRADVWKKLCELPPYRAAAVAIRVMAHLHEPYDRESFTSYLVSKAGMKGD